jgi:hypothetical protein
MMNFGQTPGGNGNQAYPAATASQAVPASTAKEIPYDYVANFRLQGIPGNRVQEVINISVDGAFVATDVGYSFIPAPLPDPAVRISTGRPLPGTRPLFPAAFPQPQATNTLLTSLFSSLLPTVENPLELILCLVRHTCGIDFKYSIIDSGTGRELQNLPIHNIAGLGEANGFRPFRTLAKPVMFMPRSTIRIEIIEVSNGSDTGYSIYGYNGPNQQRVTSELQMVLHGYKMLGYGTGGP